MRYEAELDMLTSYEREVFDFAVKRGYLAVPKCTKRPFLMRAWSLYTWETKAPYAVLHLGQKYADVTVVVRTGTIRQKTRESLRALIEGYGVSCVITPTDVTVPSVRRPLAHKIAAEVVAALRSSEVSADRPAGVENSKPMSGRG